MKKTCYLLSIMLLCAFTACEDEEKKIQIKIENPSQLEQKAYADEEDTGWGFTFTSASNWKATVTETTESQNAVKPQDNKVSWLKLTEGGVERYSGMLGAHTLKVVLSPNYTGATRTAKIDVACGNEKITVTVRQDGKTADGKLPEIPDTEGFSNYDEEKLIQQFDANTNTGSITFTTSGAWTSTDFIFVQPGESKDWFTYTPDSGNKAGTYTVRFQVKPNPWKKDREATISFSCRGKELTLVVRQLQEEGER